MSYPRLDPGPGPSPGQTRPSIQDEIDATRQRTIEALYRALSRVVSDVGRDWQHCGKAACLRSRRCRGFACESNAADDEA